VEALLQMGKRGNALFVINKELNAMQLGLLSGLALASFQRGYWTQPRVEWHEDKGFLRWFFVPPEGHMTVARRFIAGSGST
jgi:regulator of RNase E activity RraB